MNIGIDIDDTLSTVSVFQKTYVPAFVTDNQLPYQLVNENAYYISDMYDLTEEEKQKLWDAVHEGMFLNAPVRQDAKQVLTKLKNNGHKLYIVTARSYKRFKDPYAISKTWLDENQIPYDELIVNSENKADICKQNNISVFVDDWPENIKQISSIGVKTFTMKATHNQDFAWENTQFVDDWQTVLKEIEKM